MPNIIYSYNQPSAYSVDACVKLGFIDGADFLLWAAKTNRKAKFDFAMDSSDPYRLADWWGIKLYDDFDFNFVACGHYGELGDDFACDSLERLAESLEEDCEPCSDTERERVALAKFIGSVSKDHGGAADYIFVELTPDMLKWLAEEQGKTVINA